MTLIVASHGIMAADHYSSTGDLASTLPPGEHKIVRTPQGFLFGSGGRGTNTRALREWAKNGMDWSNTPKMMRAPDDEDLYVFMWMELDGRVFKGTLDFHWNEVAHPGALGTSEGQTVAETLSRIGWLPPDILAYACKNLYFIEGPVQVEVILPPVI